MEGLDLEQTSNPSLAGNRNVFKINDDDDDCMEPYNFYTAWNLIISTLHGTL